MTYTINDLWYGNITACDLCGADDSKIGRLFLLMERTQEELNSALTGPQKALLQKYIDCADEYCCSSAANAFHIGFCLAVRLMSEALGS